jgi:hypothetical protein
MKAKKHVIWKGYMANMLPGSALFIGRAFAVLADLQENCTD